MPSMLIRACCATPSWWRCREKKQKYSHSTIDLENSLDHGFSFATTAGLQRRGARSAITVSYLGGEPAEILQGGILGVDHLDTKVTHDLENDLVRIRPLHGATRLSPWRQR